MTQEQIAVTQKSIHLLTQCLHYQRLRFDKARMATCQAAMFLRLHAIHLDVASTSLENYSQLLSSRSSSADALGIQNLLRNAHAMQMREVERKRKAFYRSQDITLREHRKIDCMERTLIKLQLRQRHYSKA